MALSASTLAGLIDSNLVGFGATGSNKTIFCSAVAAGIVMSIVGKTFTTTDVGFVAGPGTGVGASLVGMTSGNMVSVAIAALPTTGVNANNLMQAIMIAVVVHLQTAQFTSTHGPVYLGTGTIVVGSITVSTSEMAGNIDSQLGLAGAAGSNRTVLSNAIASGIVTEILASATGQVIISGTTMGTPNAGTGTGSGVIS